MWPFKRKGYEGKLRAEATRRLAGAVADECQVIDGAGDLRLARGLGANMQLVHGTSEGLIATSAHRTTSLLALPTLELGQSAEMRAT